MIFLYNFHTFLYTPCKDSSQHHRKFRHLHGEISNVEPRLPEPASFRWHGYPWCLNNVVSECVTSVHVPSTSPSRPVGRRVVGKDGLALLLLSSALAAAKVEASLALEEAIVPRGTRCWSQEYPAPSPSLLLRGWQSLILAERHGKKWYDTHHFPANFSRVGWLGGSNINWTPMLECHCCLTAQGYKGVFVCVYIYVVSECALTQWLPSTSKSLALSIGTSLTWFSCTLFKWWGTQGKFSLQSRMQEIAASSWTPCCWKHPVLCWAIWKSVL